MLDSKGIPFRLSRFGGQAHIYVPAIQEKQARKELTSYHEENTKSSPRILNYPVYKNYIFAIFFVLPLVLWHGLQIGWWPVPDTFPDPRAWQNMGRLDSIRIYFHGEWQRLATSLTLHSGLAHLAGNVTFGALFLALLARIIGVGRAFLLAVAGGISGNFFSILLHEPVYVSVGFSTALFSCIGILAAITSFRLGLCKKSFLPFAGALGLLAMLGTSGENTDYLAHICGLAAGFITGLWEAKRIAQKWPGIPQILAGFFGICLVFLAWIPAFVTD